MNFTRKLKKLLNTRPYERLVNTHLKNEDKYKAAGSVFTDGKLILAGYQPLKNKPFISGIGGKKEDGEIYQVTALRETVEELFEFETVPEKLIEDLMSVTPEKVIQNGSYIMMVYNFNDLATMLKIISKYKLKSKLYDSAPLTLMDLLFKRKIELAVTPEISHLALLPLVQHEKSTPYVNSYFIEDMPILMK
jgi:hypothetical protein